MDALFWPAALMTAAAGVLADRVHWRPRPWNPHPRPWNMVFTLYMAYSVCAHHVWRFGELAVSPLVVAIAPPAAAAVLLVCTSDFVADRGRA